MGKKASKKYSKEVRMQLLQMRITIGYSAGIIIGMLGAGVVIVLLGLNIWLRIFTAIGIGSALIGTVMGFMSAVKQFNAFKKAIDGEQFSNDNN